VSNPPGTAGTVPEPTPTEVPNRHDLVDPRPHAPERVVVDPADPRRLHVRFWGGIPECYGAEVTVRESATQVVVALRSGRIPGGAEVCIDLAQYQQVTVALAAPLGTRTIRTDPA
jgi:hypothetical protein